MCKEKEKNLNLVDDPWILLRKPDGSVVMVSIKTALLKSEDFLELAGESATQNIAVLRLLEAILQRVISSTAPDGTPSALTDPIDALNRWEDIWKSGHLPEKPVRAYLERVKADFWLRDDTRPFAQSPGAAQGTQYKASKLVGTLAESSNKKRLFQQRAFEDKESIPIEEAARWLLNLNAFDDTSSKATKKGLPSVGAGWLGKLGLIYAKGKNFFQTLMLNLILLKNGEELWPKNVPYWESWEKTDPGQPERIEISPPDNPAALYTMPSRRILLHFNPSGRVDGFSLLGGQFFDRTAASVEQNTLWRKADPKKENSAFIPKRHSSARQLWRDFSIIAEKDNQGHVPLPGIVRWIETLKTEDLIPKSMPVEFEMPFVEYGDKDFFITDLSNRSLLLYPALLTKTGAQWRRAIETEISKIEKMAVYTGMFAKTIALSSGKSGDSLKRDYEKGQAAAYSAVDAPFRNWLESLNPEAAELGTQKQQEWEDKARTIFLSLAKTLTAGLPAQALLGRSVTEKDGTHHYSAAQAENRYRHQIYLIYPKDTEGDNA